MDRLNSSNDPTIEWRIRRLRAISARIKANPAVVEKVGIRPDLLVKIHAFRADLIHISEIRRIEIAVERHIPVNSGPRPLERA